MCAGRPRSALTGCLAGIRTSVRRPRSRKTGPPRPSAPSPATSLVSPHEQRVGVGVQQNPHLQTASSTVSKSSSAASISSASACVQLPISRSNELTHRIRPVCTFCQPGPPPQQPERGLVQRDSLPLRQAPQPRAQFVVKSSDRDLVQGRLTSSDAKLTLFASFYARIPQPGQA